MKYNSIIKQFYLDHRVPSPVNFTFTQRQVVDGQWISDEVSQQNFRHFANLLNSQVYGKAFKRFGKKLSMFVVREHDAIHRHHLHCVIEKPSSRTYRDFVTTALTCWGDTRFGYYQNHFEVPATNQRETGWIDYCLKQRSKADYLDSIDWMNSTCFEL